MNKTDIKNTSQSSENIVNDIAFTMDMEDMPLNKQEKQRLRDCISGKVNIHDISRETIAKYAAYGVK